MELRELPTYGHQLQRFRGARGRSLEPIDDLRVVAFVLVRGGDHVDFLLGAQVLLLRDVVRGFGEDRRIVVHVRDCHLHEARGLALIRAADVVSRFHPDPEGGAASRIAIQSLFQTDGALQREASRTVSLNCLS